MPDNIEIMEVQISQPRIVKVSNIDHEEQQSWIDIAISVKNQSLSKTLHAISKPRILRYDPDTQTLLVGFSEPEPSTDIKYIHKFPPELIPILPSETKVLNVSVPMVIKDIRPSGRLTPDIVVTDVSNLKQIACRVSYSDTPFRAVLSESSVDMSRKLNQWGNTVEKTFKKTIPTDKAQHKEKSSK